MTSMMCMRVLCVCVCPTDLILDGNSTSYDLSPFDPKLFLGRIVEEEERADTPVFRPDTMV